METLQESIKVWKREKIYVKPYLSQEIFNELDKNLPNNSLPDNLLYQIDWIPDSASFQQMVDSAYSARERRKPKWTAKAQFPFAFHFSIINKWVAVKDRVFEEEYNNNRKDNLEYRPFFIEFKGYCRNKKEFSTMYEHIYEFCRKDDTVFFPAYFVPDNVRNDPFVREIRSSAIAILIGDVLTSASPIESIGGRLLILESEPDLPNDYVALINDDRYRCRSTAYTPAEIDTLQSVLDKEFSRETPENVTVYNVGQGYCASITMKSGIAVFSDIGLSTNPQELSLPEVDSAKRQIAKVIPTAVVLSHWDMDHILGVTNADDAIYDAVWIVPDIYTLKNSIKTYPNFISTSAKRLLKYLDWRNSNKLIRISDRFVRAMLYQNSTQTFSIWTGERRSVSKKNRKNENFTITAANNFGLMLFLGAKVTALLPGDCEYGVFPGLLYSKEINYLVAPHHCSRMSNPRIMPATQGKKSAILTYGRYNSYGHPNQTHLEDLQNLGYEIIPIEPVPARILPL